MMRGKLYIKIFFSFLFLLLVSEILIFGIFRFVAEKSFHDDLMKYISGGVILFKDAIEGKLNMTPGGNDDLSPELIEFISRFERDYGLKIWIRLPGGKIAGFIHGKIPDIPEGELKKSGDFYYKFKRRRSPFYYVKVPLKFPDKRKGFLNLLYSGPRPPFHETYFLFGLAIIGFIIALLLYPFSRYITKPLKKLAESADNISKGDLSQRVNVKSRDEIGELAGSFNSMAGTIESMVKGTRELTANISHQLRSPLARIRVAEEIIAEKIGGADSDVDKLLNSIEEEIEEMDDLIGQVLLLSKLDKKQQTEKREDVDIIKAVREIFDRYKTAFEKKPIKVTFTSDEESCIITTVRDEIRTAFSNLVDNAIKYTDKGGIIDISIKKVDNGIKTVIFNTCSGLNGDELVNMFRPFYRISPGEASGSGLGLAITRKIVENHGGSIGARNIEGGLVVEIVIPCSNGAI